MPPTAQRRDPTRSRLAALPFALASACLLLFQLGYAFEAGDQLQYLLLPYREIFPEFLPGDWFTWQTSHYHISFAWLVRGLHALTGPLAFARGMFVAHGLNLALFGFAIWRLASALGFGTLEASFCVLVFGAIRQVGLAGALVNHAGLVPADLALAPFLLACAAFGERRALAMGAWLGVSGLMHANYAVLGPLVLFPLELVRARRERTAAMPLLRAAGVFALIALPTLALVVGTFLAHDAAPSAVAVTLFVRSPHHYDLAAMRADEFYFAALLALLGAPYWRARTSSAQHAAYLQLTAALSGVIAVGAIGSGLHVVSLARLFTWRMSIPLFALLLLGAAATLKRYLLARNPSGVFWFVAGCASLLTFAQRDPLEPSAWNAAPRFAAGMLLAFAVAGALLQFGRGRIVWLSVLGSALAAGLALHVARTAPSTGTALGLHWLDARIDIEARPRRLFSLIRERTPNDARFLIPPGQNQFRLQARRAVFVDWKCAPMKGDEALEWKRRMLQVMGTVDFPARGYELPRAADALYYARPLPELAKLARAEGLTHLLVRRSNLTQPEPGLRKLFSLGEYVVFAL
jgi:hypothetical protein